MKTAPRGRAILSALALLAVSVLPAGAQPKAPRTLAFVVGIEHYDDGDLDKIQFAADDARQVYELLKVVTDLHPRSVLRVADDADKSKLTADTVRTELQKFVQLIDNNMNVVVYFGGHGTLSEADSLWYLPSNYSTTARTGYISFNEIRGMFVERISGRNLYNTSLTFFVNMCGAGNAVVPGRTNLAVDNEREEVEAVQKLLSQQKFGLQKYAIIPATQRRVNTFEEEKLGSSVFAYHLRDGLKGAAAANGVVTTGLLFSFLEKRLGPLARHGDFDPDIPLGVTQRIEGLSNYLVGSALLASAQALEGSGPSAERTSHRAALLDLAADRLAAVPSSAADLGARATLRSAQVDALRNRRRDPSALNALSSSPDAGGDAAETAQLKELYADQAIPTITLPALRQSLDDGAPFYALLLDSPTSNRSQEGDSEVGPWQAVLKSFKGLKGLQTIVVPGDGSPSSAMLETVTIWTTAEKEAATRARLIVVYVGASGLQGADRKPIASPKGSEGAELYPFGRRDVDRIAGAWSGPLTFFYLGPFGGVLLNGEAPVHHDVSLLLAAKEPNGMTFTSYRNDGGGTAGLLARAFKEHTGNIDEYPPLLSFLRERGPNLTIGSDWVTGSPVWIPRWGQSTARPSVERQLAPLRRFALHVSTGCTDQQLETCDAASGTPDPFELLVKAAQADLANATDTMPDYGGAAARLRAAASATPKGPGADRTRATLKALAEIVDKRSAATKKRGARRVIVLTLGVEEYTSPLVADLPGTRKDLDAYGAALKKIFESAKISALVRNVRMVTSASEITAAIQAERDGMAPDDLLVLVYSGRGLEIGGRRYLSAGSARPCDESAFANQRSPCGQREWTELADLWEIAELMRDRSLVAVYDTQFTVPVAEGRHDELLDKHLSSGRRELPDQDVRLAAAPRVKGDQSSPFELREAGRLPSRQLHIWFEGTLTAAVAPSSKCVVANVALASPLAAAIVGSMPASPSATYREWLQKASGHPCLTASDADDSSPRTLVAQGAVDLPLLATGEGAEWVDYFRDDTARGEANIRAAAAVVDDAMRQFPDNRNRLSKAAILLAVAALDRPGPSTSLGSVSEALSEADQMLRDVTLGTAEDEKALRGLLYELRARRWVLAGDPLQARVQLLNAEVEALAERSLAERLVALTDDAIRLQPETLVDETSRLLEFADASFKARDASKAADPLGPARRRLNSMLRTEEMRRAGKYVIGPVVSR